MKTRSILFMFVGLGTALGSCAPPAVPQRPVWDVDVFPILQGSCNHCHGETVGRLPGLPAGRLDFCDPTPFVEAEITTAGFLGAKTGSLQFPAHLRPLPGKTRPNMPPPPASELSDYERDVLLKWGADTNMDKCNKQVRNREPNLKVIDKVWDGDLLKLTIEVSDPDQDTVLGKVTVGAAKAIIEGSGRRTVEVAGANENDPIEVLLHDGYVSRTEEI